LKKTNFVYFISILFGGKQLEKGFRSFSSQWEHYADKAGVKRLNAALYYEQISKIFSTFFLGGSSAFLRNFF